MTKHLNKGFTLIELLVVIAIIGILSSVIIASLSTARSKGADASVKANLDTIKSQAGVYFNDNGLTFVGLCGDPTVSRAIDTAKNATGATTTTNTDINVPGSGGVVTCHAASNSWAVEMPLKTDTSKFWCVNDAGLSVINNGTTLDALETDCTP